MHRLLAETYIENPHNLPQVNHIDGNKLNNHISNLEWMTNSSNTQHGYDNGLYTTTYRQSVKMIHKETGEVTIFKSIRNLSDVSGYNRKTVTNILKGVKITNNYKHNFEYVNE